ncbi:MAG TPA: hypothetical protein VIF02_00955 [Methylocella sp.]
MGRYRQAGLQDSGRTYVQWATGTLEQIQDHVRKMGHGIDWYCILAAVPWTESMYLKHLGSIFVCINGPVIPDWNLDAIMNDRRNVVWSPQFDHLQ